MEALAVRENENDGGLEKRVMGWSGSMMEGEMTVQAEECSETGHVSNRMWISGAVKSFAILCPECIYCNFDS